MVLRGVLSYLHKRVKPVETKTVFCGHNQVMCLDCFLSFKRACTHKCKKCKYFHENKDRSDTD